MSASDAAKDEDEGEDEAPWLVVDALTGTLHDLNDHLNQIVLQAELLRMLAPESLHPEVLPIRRLALAAGERVRELQTSDGARRRPPVVLDLNAVAEGLTCPIERSGAPAPLKADPGELRRALRLLLDGARAARIETAPGPVVALVIDRTGERRTDFGPQLLVDRARSALLRRTEGRFVQGPGPELDQWRIEWPASTSST